MKQAATPLPTQSSQASREASGEEVGAVAGLSDNPPEPPQFVVLRITQIQRLLIHGQYCLIFTPRQLV